MLTMTRPTMPRSIAPAAIRTEGLEVGQVWAHRRTGRRIAITRIDAPFELRWAAVDPFDGHPLLASTLFASTLRRDYIAE